MVPEEGDKTRDNRRQGQTDVFACDEASAARVCRGHDEILSCGGVRKRHAAERRVNWIMYAPGQVYGIEDWYGNN